MRAWRTHAWGPPSEALRLDEIPVPEPGPGEVLVRNLALPLNLNDMERVTGGNMMVVPELPLVPGMEVMGEVVACGAGAEAWQGRRVVAITKQGAGAWAEYTACPGHSTFEMPEDIALPGAAALLFPFHLAWLGLIDRAGLIEGETVLVHAAAGGAGSAAVQVAKQRGARVLATAGSAEKCALARELGADVAVDYGAADFADVVLEETGGRGVDVVFDTVGEAVMEAGFRVTAYGGRYVMIGFASDKTAVDRPLVVPRRVAAGNLHLCGVLLAYAPEALIPAMKKGLGWNFTPSGLGAEITRQVVEWVRKGAVRPVVGREVAFEDIPSELEALFERRTTGRTVARLD